MSSLAERTELAELALAIAREAGDLLLAGFLALLTVLIMTFLVSRTNEETDRVAGLNPGGDAWVPLAPVATVTGIMEATGAGKRLEPAAEGIAAGDAPLGTTYVDASTAAGTAGEEK